MTEDRVILNWLHIVEQPATRPPQVCQYDQATCSNGDCIPKSYVCDGKFDCTDGSDEMRCSKYDRHQRKAGYIRHSYFMMKISRKRFVCPFRQVRTDVSPTSFAAIISSASASCGVATATRTARTTATRRTARRLPRDLRAVTTSSPAAAINSASRKATTATWSATAWTAATKLDAVSNDENFMSAKHQYFVTDRLTIFIE